MSIMMAYITLSLSTGLGPLALACMTLIVMACSQMYNNSTGSRKRTMVEAILDQVHLILSRAQAELIAYALNNLPDTPKSPSKYKRRRGNRPRGRIFRFSRMATIVPIVAMTSTAPGRVAALSNNLRTIGLDAESRVIGIDNRASKCISRHRGNFVGPLAEQEVTIQGYSGSLNQKVQKGTL